MAWEVLLEQKTLTVGTHWTAEVVLWDNKVYHALEYVIAGAGTVTITPYTSVSGKSWVNNGAKASGVGATDGPDSDGVNNIPLTLKPAELIKFKIGVAGDSVIFTAWFTQKWKEEAMVWELPKVKFFESELVRGLIIAAGWLAVYWLGVWTCWRIFVVK